MFIRNLNTSNYFLADNCCGESFVARLPWTIFLTLWSFFYRTLLDSLNLGKNQDLELTARFWSSQQVKPKLEINDFIIRSPIGRTCYDESTVIIPTTNPINLPLEDPNTNIIEKKAHRRLRIRKKKMKVHRRKRRWKKYW